jgi:hypothetical protein
LRIDELRIDQIPLFTISMKVPGLQASTKAKQADQADQRQLTGSSRKFLWRFFV